MKKTKSICVTALVMLMLAVIALAAYRLAMPVFIVLTAVFAGTGFAGSGVWFYWWLSCPSEEEEEELPPPEVKKIEKEENK